MLNFSPEKLLLVAIIALIVLGPNRLPQAARTVGRFMADLRRMSSSFHDEVRDALGEPTEALHSAISDFRPPANMRKSVRDAISTTLMPPPAESGPATSAAARASSAVAPAPSASSPAAASAVPPTVTAAPLAAPDDPALN